MIKKIKAWIIVRLGPDPSDKKWYMEQVIDGLGYRSKMLPSNKGIMTTVSASACQYETCEYFAGMQFMKFADDNNISYDNNKLSFHKFNDADGYKGILFYAYE